MNLNLSGMAEVTRLTRAGRLAEAVALLQGACRMPGPSQTPDGLDRQRVRPALPSGQLTDMVPPSSRSDHWTAPGSDAGQGSGSAPTGGVPEPRAAGPMRGFLDRLKKPGSSPGLGGSASHRRQDLQASLPDGARFEEHSFINQAGRRTYKLYIPGRYRGEPLPLVVMLHGCTQSPDDFAAGTRMNEWAEKMGLLVAYPRQPSSANPSKCWNWFSAGDQLRDRGEPSLIAGITRQIMRDLAVDPRSRLCRGAVGRRRGGSDHGLGLSRSVRRDLRPLRTCMRGCPEPAFGLRRNAAGRIASDERRETSFADNRVSRRPRLHGEPGKWRPGHRPIEGGGGAAPDEQPWPVRGRDRLHTHRPRGGERAPAPGAMGAAWGRPCLVGREPCPDPTPTPVGPTQAARCCGSFAKPARRRLERRGVPSGAAVRANRRKC